jgi:four helix bundle protein
MGKEFQEIKLRNHSLSFSVIQFIDKIIIKRIFYSMIDQLLRSITSIEANLVEAKSAYSKKDFIKFYEISLKSSNETEYWLYLLRDRLKLYHNELNRLLKETAEISKIIASIIIKLKNTKATLIKENYILYGIDNSDNSIII